jgi:hypothetical protein
MPTQQNSGASVLIKFVLRLSVTTIFIGASASIGAHAGGCLKDAREVRLNKESVVRLSEYLCRSDNDAQAQVRVQFQRLTGLAGGALLNGGNMPWTTTLYGNQRQIVSNDALLEYRNLLTRFGSQVKERYRGADERFMSIHITQPAEENVPFANAEKGAEINSFSLPRFPDLPLVDETVAILTNQAWPNSLSMYYTGMVGGDDLLERPLLDAMTLWRQLGPGDLEDYSKRLARYNSLVADRKYGTRTNEPKGLGLLRYLVAGGWPEKFLYSEAKIDVAEGCSVFDFRNEPSYSIAVDVAVIENVSTKAIILSQLVGRSTGGNQLRQVDGSAPLTHDKGNPLQAGAASLAPSQRLIVPLRITLIAYREDLDKQISESRFRKLENSKSGTVFQTKVYSSLRGNPAGEDMYFIRKVRETFKPPSYPTLSDFAFGPEWSLTGLVLNGEEINFDSVAPNILDLTYDSGVGSCPILYVSSGTDVTWFRHGKIIHQALTRANRQSEAITFDGFTNRFRIAEEELEHATISDVKLTIELTDGNTLILQPDDMLLTAEKSIELYANDEVEFNFTLPANLLESDVVHSRLNVTGYYDRYPMLFLSRHLGKNQ